MHENEKWPWDCIIILYRQIWFLKWKFHLPPVKTNLYTRLSSPFASIRGMSNMLVKLICFRTLVTNVVVVLLQCTRKKSRFFVLFFFFLNFLFCVSLTRQIEKSSRWLTWTWGSDVYVTNFCSNHQNKFTLKQQKKRIYWKKSPQKFSRQTN